MSALHSALVLGLAFVPLDRLAAQITDPVTLQQVLDCQADSAGGRARLDRISSLVTVRTPTSVTTLRAPSSVLVEGFDSTGRVTYAEGYDGATAWEQTEKDTARRVVTGRAAVALSRVAEWPGNLLPLYRMTELGYRLELLPPDSSDGWDVIGVRLTLRDGFQRDYLLERGSCRLVLARDRRELHANDGNTREIETVFSDYRGVDGYWFPFTVYERDRVTGERLSGRTVLGIFPNEPAAQALFSPSGKSEVERLRGLLRRIEAGEGH